MHIEYYKLMCNSLNQDIETESETGVSETICTFYKLISCLFHLLLFLIMSKFNYMKIINITINNFHEIFIFLTFGNILSATNRYIQNLFF